MGSSGSRIRKSSSRLGATVTVEEKRNRGEKRKRKLDDDATSDETNGLVWTGVEEKENNTNMILNYVML